MVANRTQMDLDALLEKAIAQVAEVGLKPGRIERTVYLTRAKKTYGKCSSTPDGFTVHLSKYFKDNCIEEVMQTLVHEVLHTLPGCMNHGSSWKTAAEIVNAKYGYNVQRCNSMEMANLTEEDKVATKHYAVECLSCGAMIYRERKSKLITHTDHYRCKCGGQLVLKEGAI